MNAVMLSIRPQWRAKIANGEKTIEVRKSRPKLETPFKCYIYETGGEKHGLHRPFGKPFGYEGAQAIIGEFVCDRIDMIAPLNHCDADVEKESCLTREQIVRYLNGKGYGWHISALQIYDNPKELSEFYRYCTEKDDCHKCIHWDSSYDNTYYEPPDPPFEGCRTGEKKHFTRPPQSWCYVEELI